MVTICARGNDGVEVVCRRGFVELGDGLEVQRSMGREVPIDHRGIRGLQGEQVVARKGVPLPGVVGVRHDGLQHNLQLAVHRDHGRGQGRGPVGLVGGKFGGGA